MGTSHEHIELEDVDLIAALRQLATLADRTAQDVYGRLDSAERCTELADVLAEAGRLVRERARQVGPKVVESDWPAADPDRAPWPDVEPAAMPPAPVSSSWFS